MKKERLIKVFVSLLLILSNISCDQITKDKVRESISKYEVIEVIGNSFMLTKVENNGAALNLGGNLTPFLKIIFLQVFPLTVLLLLFVYIVREKMISKLNLIGFSFIIGGGIGNIYDRIFFNSVTDFMYVEYGGIKTAIFNMADVSVVIGCLLVLLNILLVAIKRKPSLSKS
ncbi:signal peptidase II [Flavivirga eckloniae]|uniref:Lipoprotein signal peptidase n=1 Tax=Flavivirga eckloniae TaxID=1803846 RepID=A0A2K9PUI4_9FLAO|nr:signal peptidase II [Flavivirga eckloniae]AUP80730.1 signal peptidase II [Flavivirga eckloniae]